MLHIGLHRIPKDDDCILKSKNVHSSVPSSTIHNSQDTEMTCKSITRRMDKEDVVHVYVCGDFTVDWDGHLNYSRKTSVYS